MNNKSAWLSAFSWALLAAQVVLIAFTAWFMPTRLRRTRAGFVIYILSTLIAWSCYTALAIVCDTLAGNDIPGIGYLVLGAVSGFIGIIIYARRPDEVAMKSNPGPRE